MTTALSKSDGILLDTEKARAFLVRCRDADEVKNVRDKARAVELYLRSRNASVDSQRAAAAIVLRAERRLGELCAEMPKAKGAAVRGVGKRGNRQLPHSTPTLADRGVSKIESSRWQKLAAIPAPEFEAYVEKAATRAERPSLAGALALVKAQAKHELADELAAKPLPLPTARFDVIVIDPPWRYEKRVEDATHRGRNPYPDMSTEEICALPVARHAEASCLLWLWTTNAFMRQVFVCLDAWGFQEKTILTWVKDRMGVGDWLRGRSEHCILAVRGKPLVMLTNQTTVLEAPLREHSRKPEAFYALVEALCPGTKLEMFAREARDGWQAWGAEAPASAA